MVALKALLVDTHKRGHHKIYLKTIITKIDKTNFEVICALPFELENMKTILINFPKKENNLQFFLDRKRWLYELTNISNNESPDIIHFLYGDSFYQLGGLGLKRLFYQTKAIIITQHHSPNGFIRKRLFKHTINWVNKVVVHTEKAKEIIEKNTKNPEKIKLIDYPAFHSTYLDKKEAIERLGISNGKPILLALGGTRYDKGLDILLSALKSVNEEYHLVIAGKEEYFEKSFIEEKIIDLTGNATVRLNIFSDEEFGWYVDAADCVVVPYRKIFDGASGPMVEAVWRRKPVIGPNHGCLGELIAKYELGYTFETENVESLAETITNYLRNPSSFRWTEKAEEYRKRLDPDVFAEKYLDLYKSLLNNKEVY